MTDKYRIRKHVVSSLTRLFFCFLSFFLYSCSIESRKLGINPITREELRGDMRRYVAGVFPIEMNNKFIRLENEGFVGGADPNNDDMRKHLMFVFYNSLRHRQENRPLQYRLNFFQNQNNQNVQNLVWGCRISNIGFGARQRQVLEFRLKNLFGANAPVGNRNRAMMGQAPNIGYNNNIEEVQIDHLLKDNNVTIELPVTLHKQKTLLIDNLIDPPNGRPIRDSAGYWRRR